MLNQSWSDNLKLVKITKITVGWTEVVNISISTWRPSFKMDYQLLRNMIRNDQYEE